MRSLFVTWKGHREQGLRTLREGCVPLPCEPLRLAKKLGTAKFRCFLLETINLTKSFSVKFIINISSSIRKEVTYSADAISRRRLGSGLEENEVRAMGSDMAGVRSTCSLCASFPSPLLLIMALVHLDKVRWQCKANGPDLDKWG